MKRKSPQPVSSRPDEPASTGSVPLTNGLSHTGGSPDSKGSPDCKTAALVNGSEPVTAAGAISSVD